MAEPGDREVSYPDSVQLVVGIGDRLPPPGGEDLANRLGKMQMNSGPASCVNETLAKSSGTNFKGIVLTEGDKSSKCGVQY